MEPGRKVEGIYAYIEIRTLDGTEGIIAFGFGETQMTSRPYPMVTSSEATVIAMKPMARVHAEASGNRVELRYFAGPMRVIEEFMP